MEQEKRRRTLMKDKELDKYNVIQFLSLPYSHFRFLDIWQNQIALSQEKLTQPRQACMVQLHLSHFRQVQLSLIYSPSLYYHAPPKPRQIHQMILSELLYQYFLYFLTYIDINKLIETC